MRLFQPALVVGAMLAAGPSPAPAQSTARSFPADSIILSILKQRVGEKRSAGIVVGLVERSGATRVVAFGDPGPGRLPLDGNTLFEIGSVSKVFTSTLLARMVLEGKVTLDDPVQKYLPATVRMPTRNGKAITLAHLASQNSGLPRMPTNLPATDPANPYADFTVRHLYDFLSGYALPRDPGEEFEYSNLGVGLLGHVLSLTAGKSYEQLARELIWSPLNMLNTMITFSPWGRQHLALGHDAEGTVVGNWDLPTLPGAGAIRSTANDMLRFVAANLHTDRGPLGPAMGLAQQQRIRAPALNAGIGLNWILQQAGTDTVIWHNGGTAGYTSFVGFIRSQQLGVVVLTNSGGPGADDIGFHLLSPTFPLRPPPPVVKQRETVEVGLDILSRYVGSYQLSPTVAIEVKVISGALYAQVTGQGALRLWPESEIDFFYKEVAAQITFVRDAAGKVTGLVLHQGGRDSPATRMK